MENTRYTLMAVPGHSETDPAKWFIFDRKNMRNVGSFGFDFEAARAAFRANWKGVK